MMTNDELWCKHYDELMTFVKKNKRRPSKYYLEERRMYSWIKFNKKRYARGKMPEERKKKFDEYLALAEKYRRVNTTTYANPSIFKELDLFNP